jgi:GDSL-like Lipase/Acylhydrolase
VARRGCPSGRIANVATLALTVTLTFLVVEAGFRAFASQSIVLFPRNHAAAQYGPFLLRSMTPNIVFWHESVDGRWKFRINNKGFRDERDYRYEKAKDTFRVLLLGDSHTAGLEVDQDLIYAKVLESGLRERGINAEVLNSGVAGFGTAEQLAFLENEGLRYAPDAVVFGFFANDYSDNARSGLFKLEDGRLVVASHSYAPAVDIIRWTQAVPGLKWLGENSYSYSFVFNTVWEHFKLRSIERAGKQSSGPEVAVPIGEITNEQDDLSAALLSRIGELGRKKGFQTILVDIPAIVEDHTLRSSFSSQVRAVGAQSFTYVLEFEEYLRGRPASQPVHVLHGHHHLNAYGHERLGKALAEVLAGRRHAKAD